MNIKKILREYNVKKIEDITIAVLGSHSALDVCSGAKHYGFKTLVIVEEKRDRTYGEYYFSKNGLGCVDEVIKLKKFSDILKPEYQRELRKRKVIFVPHRSFEVYVSSIHDIEEHFEIPMFGNRYLLKTEERDVKPNQYDLLKAAKIRYPKQVTNPKDIDRLCLVKVLERKRKHERAFFLAKSIEEYNEQSKEMILHKIITKEALKKAVIEEYIVGVQVNFNFFYSNTNNRLELMGTDTRRQTNVEGYARVPVPEFEKVYQNYGLAYEEVGHIAVTVLESLLEKAFKMGEDFVQATKETKFGGVIGPFGLQTMIIPGPPKKEIIVFDVSPRMPGSPGISATPYGYYLHREAMSAGKRVALEIKEAIEQNKLEEVLT